MGLTRRFALIELEKIENFCGSRLEEKSGGGGKAFLRLLVKQKPLEPGGAASKKAVFRALYLRLLESVRSPF
jgi:hypothetical protein